MSADDAPTIQPFSSITAVPPTHSTPRSAPDAIADRDEDAVHARGGHRRQLLGRMLARGRALDDGPVDRHAQQVGAAQGQRPRHLRELEVVTDEHAEPAERGVQHRRHDVARREDQPLAIPEVRLAVDGENARRVHDRGAVVEPPVGAALAEPADDERPERAPPRQRGRLDRDRRRLLDAPRRRSPRSPARAARRCRPRPTTARAASSRGWPSRSPTVGASRRQATRVMPATGYAGSTPTWSSRPRTRFIFVPVSLRSRSSSRRESRDSA